MGMGQVKMPQTHCSYQESPFFPLTNSSWIAASLWLTSSILKKLIIRIFAGFPLAFIEMKIVEGLYSSNFVDLICYLELLA